MCPQGLTAHAHGTKSRALHDRKITGHALARSSSQCAAKHAGSHITSQLTKVQHVHALNCSAAGGMCIHKPSCSATGCKHTPARCSPMMRCPSVASTLICCHTMSAATATAQPSSSRYASTDRASRSSSISNPVTHSTTQHGTAQHSTARDKLDTTCRMAVCWRQMGITECDCLHTHQCASVPRVLLLALLPQGLRPPSSHTMTVP